MVVLFLNNAFDTGQSKHFLKQRVVSDIIDMLNSFSSQQQHNENDKRNITDAVIAFKSIIVKGLLDSGMDLIKSKIIINQAQAAITGPV